MSSSSSNFDSPMHAVTPRMGAKAVRSVDPSSGAKRETFFALDGLRGIAALAVMLFHAHPIFGVQLLPNGYLAVDIFFILSGCVIAHAYESRLDGGMPWGRFLRLRLVRLYPFYSLGLALGVFLAFLLIALGSSWRMTNSSLALAVFCGLLFVPIPPIQGGGSIFPLNLPAWSLFYELVVNVLYAKIIFRLSNKKLAIVVIAALLVAAAGLWRHGSGSFGPDFQDAPFALCRTIFSFCVGILIYRNRSFFNIHPVLLLIIVVCLFGSKIRNEWQFVFDFICISVVFPVIVFFIIGSKAPSYERIFSYLGSMSYGLYAIHYPVIWLAAGVAKAASIKPLSVGVVLVCVLPFACAFIERYVETPIRGVLNRKLSGLTPSAPNTCDIAVPHSRQPHAVGDVIV